MKILESLTIIVTFISVLLTSGIIMSWVILQILYPSSHITEVLIEIYGYTFLISITIILSLFSLQVSINEKNKF